MISIMTEENFNKAALTPEDATEAIKSLYLGKHSLVNLAASDLNKAVWSLFKKALRVTGFPENVTIKEEDDGSLTFVLRLTNEDSGSGVFYYKPSIELIKEIINLHTEPEFKEGNAEKYSIYLGINTAEAFIDIFLKNFHVEIGETFLGLMEIPKLLLFHSSNEMCLKSAKLSEDQKTQLKEDWNARIEVLLNERTRRTRQRIQQEIQINNPGRKPAKNLMYFFYQKVYPRWKKAKTCYKQYKTVAAAVEKFPADLIKRLADNTKYFATPQEIALEHAARLCGFKANSLETETLRTYKKDSRKWMIKTGPDAVTSEARHFFEHSLAGVIAHTEATLFLGKEPDINDLSAYEQWLLIESQEFENEACETTEK